MRAICLILPALLLGGCWSGSDDFNAMPEVMDDMESPSPSVRQQAQDRASETVGAGVNFRPHDDAQRRAAEVERYRRLYQLARDHDQRYLIDLVPVLLQRMDDDDLAVRRLAGQDVVQLTGVSYGYRADAPLAERRAAIEKHREEWQQWNSPGSRVLEFKRHPQKLREYKRQRIEDMKRRAGG